MAKLYLKRLKDIRAAIRALSVQADETMRSSDTGLYVQPNGRAAGKVGISANPLTNEGDVCLLKDGVLAMKETSTPTADANYGKLYTKNDNKLYFQDGAGAEHEVRFI